MHAGYVERNIAYLFITQSVAAAEGKAAARALVRYCGGIVMGICPCTGGGGDSTVCYQASDIALCRAHGLCAVRTDNGGIGKRDEAVKALGDLSEILEVIHMLKLHIQHNCAGGAEREE